MPRVRVEDFGDDQPHGTARSGKRIDRDPWPASRTSACASPRIKATQKITKAMQMVAAASCGARRRRARGGAAVRASAWTRCSATSPPRSATSARTPRAPGRHRRERRASARGLHRRARPVRRASTRRSCGSRASTSTGCMREGKDGQDPLRRPQGLRAACAALRRSRSSSTSTCAACARSHSSNADAVADKILALFEAGEFDVVHAVLSRVQVGDHARSRRRSRSFRPSVRGGRSAGGDRRGLRIRARRGGDPRRPAAAQHRGRRSSARCSRTSPPSRARG